MNETVQTQRYTINPEALYTFIDNESVIMSAINEKMYGLNEVATELLKQMESTALSIDELSEYLVSHYEVSKEQCRSDIAHIIQSLLSDQLIVTV